MGRYYNKTRAPLPATLRDGTAISLPSRSWVTLGPEQERSGSLNRLVQKGLLAYRGSPAPAPVQAPAPAKPEPAPPPPPPPHKPVLAPLEETKPAESDAPSIEVTSSVEIGEDVASLDLPDESEDSKTDDLGEDTSEAKGSESVVASEDDFGSESTPRPKKTRRRKRRS